MIAQSTRYAVCLGLAGGLAVALTPAVNAQIQVTGGNFNGQAAFFVPTPGTGGTTSSGKVELFDLTVQTLNLQTSRGNTSTAVFQPTAALFNAGSDNQPNANDTGTVKGLLSGLAFTGNGGTPIPFTNRVTILNFSVNSFTSSANNSGVIEGTMLSPQTAGQNPLIFLPNVEATVAPGSSYQATSGELTLGSLDAKLTTGAIDLPQSYTFQQTGSTTTTPPTDTVSRRIKFMFQGDNVIPETGTNFNGTSNNTGNSNTGNNNTGNNNTGNNNTGNNNTGNNNTGNNNTGNNNNQIRFVGQANKKFTIETVGNQSNGQYKIDSTLGAVDIKIGGPFTNATTTGTLSNTASTTYKIEGESNGILSLFALNSVGFSSTANSTSPSNTTFEFQQGGNKLTGSSTGSVDFYAVAGVNSFNSDTAFTNYQPTSSNNSTPGSNPPCNVCGNTLANNSSVLLGSTTITIGGPISVGTGSGSGSGSGSGGTGSNSGGSGNTSGGSGSGGSGNTSGGSGSGGSGNTSGGSGSGGSGNTSGGSGSGGSGSASGGSGSGSGSGGSGSGGSTDTDANPANTDVFASGGTAYSSTAQGQYQILASSNIRLVTDVKLRASKIKVKVVQRGSDRYYVVYREGSGSSGQGSSGSGSASGTGTGTTTGTGTGTTTGTGTGTTTGTTTGTGTGTGTTTGTTTGTGTGTGTTTGTTSGTGTTTGTGTGTGTASGSGSGQDSGSGTASGSGSGQDSGSGTASGSGSGQDSGSGTASGSGSGQGSGTGSGTASGSGSGQGSGTGSGTASGSGSGQGSGTGSGTASGSGSGQGSGTGSGTASGSGSGQDSGSGTASNDDQDDDQTASNDDQDDDQTASNDDQDDDQTASNDDQDDDQTASNDEQEVVYKVVGPSSRCFPGLTGLRQLSAEEAASVSSNNTSTSGNNNTSTPSNTSGNGTGTTTSPQ